MNALLILNEGAGSLRATVDPPTPEAVAEAFQSAGVSLPTRLAAATAFEETLQDAIAQRPDALFVGGGDGSISTAAQALAGTEIALGVLPVGTLNHFARDLELPVAWREAVTALAHGVPRQVDVGEVNGRVFINNCSIGSYVEAVRRRDALRRQRGWGKWWAMTLATIAVFRRLRRLRLRIEANGQTTALRAPFLVVANNRYSGRVLGYNLRARLDEGQLWIYSTRAHRHAAVLRSIWQCLLRRIDRVDGLESLAVSEATIVHDYDRLPIALDGEVVHLNSPLHFRTRPGALKVIHPRPTE